MNAAVSALVSAVRKDGKPVVRLSCADYGHEWIVDCDVYPVDELSVKPRSAGPYVFATAREAKAFCWLCRFSAATSPPDSGPRLLTRDLRVLLPALLAGDS